MIMENKTKPCCPNCGSENISVDAAARWDNEKKDWVLSGILDGGGCDNCQQEFKYPNWK